MSDNTSVVENYGAIGSLLRSAREEARLSVEEAARMLHIRVRYIHALEQGRLEDMPGLPYARGYLQTYASFLALDKEEILRRFEEIEKALGHKGMYFPRVFSQEKAPQPWMVWTGLAIMVLAYFFWYIQLHYSNKPLSLVDKVEDFSVKTKSANAYSSKDVSCLGKQILLYPTCTAMQKPYDIRFLPSEVKSVMELVPPNAYKNKHKR